jgi:hypothetical protein
VAAADNDLSVPLKPPRVAAEVTAADEVFEIASSGAAVTLSAYPEACRGERIGGPPRASVRRRR